MWSYVENNEIIDSVNSLPTLWVKGDVQYPLREYLAKGHTADLNALGWLEHNEITAPITPYQEIAGYDYTVNVDRIDALPIIVSKPLAMRKAIKIAEVKRDGYALIDALEGADPREKSRRQNLAVLAIDRQISGTPGNPNPGLEQTVSIAEQVEAMYVAIDQAIVELESHTSPETYTVNWP